MMITLHEYIIIFAGVSTKHLGFVVVCSPYCNFSYLSNFFIIFLINCSVRERETQDLSNSRVTAL